MFDLAMLRLNLSDIAIITVKNDDYHCSIHEICKSDASHLSKNVLFDERRYIKNACQRNQYQK